MIFGIDGPSFSRIPEYRIATAANFAAIAAGSAAALVRVTAYETAHNTAQDPNRGKMDVLSKTRREEP